MKVPQHSGALLLACLAVATPALAQPQGFVNLGGFRGGFQNFFQPIQSGFTGFNANVLQPMIQGVMHMLHMDHHGHHGQQGTETPQATGRDELFPSDCGRDEKNHGKLCFPDGLLCQNRVEKGGVTRFGRHNYYFSWLDSDFRTKNTKWSWFNARNYCRKRCMDLVSFESRQEWDWVQGFIDASVPYFWTSGRLCDFEGCDRPDLFPKNINGWFWSATQVAMPPTNGSRFHAWSHTGGWRPPRQQPDNREEEQLGGDTESCLAVLNNYYGDGIKWHDVACTHEKPIVCEDVDGHLAFARQKFPELRIP